MGNKMVLLEDLPNEIFTQIIQELRANLMVTDSTSDIQRRYHLYPVCLVSRRFQSLAQNELYSSFCVLKREDAVKDIPIFFQRIHDCPSLQPHVESLCLRYSEDHQDNSTHNLGFKTYSPEPWPNLQKITDLIYRRFGMEEDTERLWITACFDPWHATELLISLILLLCPNLRNLALTLPSWKEPLASTISSALSPDAPSQTGLRRLETITFFPPDGSYHIFRFWRILFLPRLHTINATNFNFSRSHGMSDLESSKQTKIFSSIRNVSMNQSIESCLRLLRFLHRATGPDSALTSIRYVVNVPEDDSLETVWRRFRYKFGILNRNLVKIGSKLTRLEVRVPKINDCILPHGVLTSTTSMQCLEWLKTDLRLLIGSQGTEHLDLTLPPNLQTLEIGDWTTKWFTQNTTHILIALQEIVEMRAYGEGRGALRAIGGLPIIRREEARLDPFNLLTILLKSCTELGVILEGVLINDKGRRVRRVDLTRTQADNESWLKTGWQSVHEAQVDIQPEENDGELESEAWAVEDEA